MNKKLGEYQCKNTWAENQNKCLCPSSIVRQELEDCMRDIVSGLYDEIVSRTSGYTYEGEYEDDIKKFVNIILSVQCASLTEGVKGK